MFARRSQSLIHPIPSSSHHPLSLSIRRYATRPHKVDRSTLNQLHTALPIHNPPELWQKLSTLIPRPVLSEVKALTRLGVLLQRHERIKHRLPLIRRLSERYSRTSPAGKQYALVLMANQWAVDDKRILDCAHTFASLADSKRTLPSDLVLARNQLRLSLAPDYRRMFGKLALASQGLPLLVHARADLLDLNVKVNQPLKQLDDELRHVLASLFSVGMLSLERITWDSPASLLQKIAHGESVHRVRSIDQLQSRLGDGRRCFGFFHPAMPDQPLVFVTVALTRDLTQNIDDILANRNPLNHESDARAAIFYAINATQRGLSGIELGNHLIKRVALELKREFGGAIDTFSTLSPIPGFVSWLEKRVSVHRRQSQSPAGNIATPLLTPTEERNILAANPAADPLQALVTALRTSWVKNPHFADILRQPLLRLCREYIVNEKRGFQAHNRVANFHLRNGATVERLNWLADTSPNGLKQSAGIMVNYKYNMDRLDRNARRYIAQGRIDVSDDFWQE